MLCRLLLPRRIKRADDAAYQQADQVEVGCGVRGHELRFQMEDRGAVQVQEMRVRLRGLQGNVAKQDQQPDDVPRCGNNHNVVPHRGGFGAVQVPDIDVKAANRAQKKARQLTLF